MGEVERAAAFIARSLAQARSRTTVITFADVPDFYTLPPDVARVRLSLADPSRSRLEGAIATLRRVAVLRRALRDVGPGVVISLQLM